MKIVMTVSDGAGAMHIGIGVEHRSGVVEIPDESLPSCVKQYLQNREWAKEAPNRYTYEALTFSILEDENNQ